VEEAMKTNIFVEEQNGSKIDCHGIWFDWRQSVNLSANTNVNKRKVGAKMMRG
jgi:hypothetical protein